MSRLSELRRTLEGFCICLIRGAVSVASLPCHRHHKQEGRKPETPAAPSVPDAEDNPKTAAAWLV